MKLFCVIFLIIGLSGGRGDAYGGDFASRVIYAVNAGGGPHRDVMGVVYREDPSQEGVASDFGKRYDIKNTHPLDAVLYQTERYTTDVSFGYDIPIKEDGDYVLVLKFCEVYFQSPGEKIFDVIFNGQPIVQNLDIYAAAGSRVAYDAYVPFRIQGKKTTFIVHQKASPLKNGKVPLRFQRGKADNPKINAFFVVKGTIDDMPGLPPQQSQHSDEEESLFEEEDFESVEYYGSEFEDNIQPFTMGKNKAIRSGPAAQDPWERAPSSEKYLPLSFIALTSVLAYGFVSVVVKFL